MQIMGYKFPREEESEDGKNTLKTPIEDLKFSDLADIAAFA